MARRSRKGMPVDETTNAAPVTELAPVDPVVAGDLVSVDDAPGPTVDAALVALPPETPEPPPVAPAADVVSDVAPEEPTAPAAVPLADIPARVWRVTEHRQRFALYCTTVGRPATPPTVHDTREAAEGAGRAWVESA